MSSSALLANGTLVKRQDDASPTVFVVIPELRDINGPSIESPLVDATDQESTGVENILGLPDFGEISAQMMYLVTNATQNLVRSDFVARTAHTYRLEFPISPVQEWEFTALVRTFGMTAALNQPLLINVTWKLTAAINFSPT